MNANWSEIDYELDRRQKAILQLQAVRTELLEALEAAYEHLEYTGYGDSWERECARESKLAEKIQKTIDKAKAI